jgi:peptide/nickel transport system ATP-binding protein
MSGEVLVGGRILPPRLQDRDRDDLRRLQIIFQNPDRSLNPSHTARRILSRPIRVFGLAHQSEAARVSHLLDRVKLSTRVLDRYPGELSGGEKQRVAIARALAAEPSVIVCDEITSALDVSVQAAIIDLLDELRGDGLALVFITHNLGVVRALAHRTVVMQSGRIVERGDTQSVILHSAHPYTQELCRSVPEITTGLEAGASALGHLTAGGVS